MTDEHTKTGKAALLLRYAMRSVLWLILAAVIFRTGISVLGWTKSLSHSYNREFVVLALLFLVLIWALRPRRGPRATDTVGFGVLLVLILISIPFVQIMKFMGVNDIPTILHYFGEHDAIATYEVLQNDYGQAVFKETAIYVIFLISAYALHRMVAASVLVTAPLIAFFVWLHPVSHYLAYKVVPPEEHALLDLPVLFSPPRIEARPERQKNLVLIYLESYERSLFFVDRLGDYVRPLDRIRLANRDFSNVAQVFGGHNSISGVFSTLCGIPLVPRNSFNFFQSEQVIGGRSFLPEFTCLPDVLKADGYTTSYLVGADMTDYSLSSFMTTHSVDHLYDVNSVPGEVRKRERTFWGVSDSHIFAEAKRQIEEFSLADAPFFLALSSLETHGPDGYPAASCKVETAIDSGLPPALRCAADDVVDLLEHIREVGILPDTDVVIMSDHLGWPTEFSKDLNALEHRRNLFVVIDGDGAETQAKLGVSFDVYPTLLEQVGYQLEDRKAYFGVSLLSDEPTLAEQVGVDVLDRAIRGNRSLSRRMWLGERSAR